MKKTWKWAEHSKCTTNSENKENARNARQLIQWWQLRKCKERKNMNKLWTGMKQMGYEENKVKLITTSQLLIKDHNSS